MKSQRGKHVLKLAVALGAMLFACAAVLAQDVTYNFAAGTDFAKYKTYKWVRVNGAQYPDQILDQQIKQSIDGQLAAKGLTKTEGDNADLDVAYQVSVSQEQQWNSYGMGGGWRMGGGMVTTTQTTLHVGTLGLDFYDPAAKQLIWRGSATKTINPSNDPNKRQKNLDKAVAKLLKKYPPPAK